MLCHKIYVSCFVSALYSLKLAFSMTFKHLHHRFFLMVTQNHPNFFNKLFKNVLHEKLNDWIMTSKKPCIFLFLHDLFAICGFSQCPPHGWLYLHCTVSVNHNIADDSVDGSYHFRLKDSNGLLAQVQHWRYVIRWLGQSIAPKHFIPLPIFSERTGSNLCFVRWVPNILTSANHLGYLKEQVERNLPRAARQPELDKLEIFKSP
jgi:hypothetical protein